MGMSGIRAPLLIAILLSVSALLPGCGFLMNDDGVFRDRSEDYKKSAELPVIKVAEDMNSTSLREIYVIPEIEEKVLLAGEFEVPRPAPLVSGADAEVVRIQKLGDESWALVELAPGQVWPQVRSFLSAAGMQVARVDARGGIIETNWATLDQSPLESRFRFRMEQGVQRGTCELHVLQMNRNTNFEVWPKRSDDLAQADDMLRAVSQFLADSADSSPVSMLAEQGLGAGSKISLQESKEGDTYIRLELPFDRAWASVARALQKSSFEITDRDRSKSTYYATFIGLEGDEDEEGWFDWLWSEDEQPLVGESFLVEMTLENDQSISIRLHLENSQTPFSRRDQQSLLAIIKGNIS
jgi:outer membrane protein assembly factor BamC